LVHEAGNRPAQLTPVGIQEGHVVEAGVPGRRRRAARALPGVQADVMVIVARRQEGGVEPELTAVRGHAQSEQVVVEADRTVEVRHPQVHMADANGGMDWLLVHAGQSAGPRVVRHR
jgi:hypothetical protein